MNFDWILSDFETVIPAESRSRDPLRNKWQIAEYTIDGLAGKMIYANPDTCAPPITIPLPLKGTYEIIVAMREDLCDEGKIKFGSDRTFDRKHTRSPVRATAMHFRNRGLAGNRFPRGGPRSVLNRRNEKLYRTPGKVPAGPPHGPHTARHENG